MLLALGCGSDFKTSPLFAEHGGGGSSGVVAAASVASVSAVSAVSSGTAGAGGGVVPPGWQWVAEGGACAAPTILHAEPLAAGCSPCGCGPLVAPGDPNGDKPRCDAGGPTLLEWGGNACPPGADTSMPLKLGACAPVAQGMLAVQMLPSAVYNPVKLYCDPQGGNVEPAAAFAADVALCPTAGSAACVERVGQHGCPVGYSERRVLYEAAADTRACSTCLCGKPAASCTVPKVSAFASKDCSGAAQDLAQVCKTAGSVKLVLAAELVGSCASSGGGVPSGKVDPFGPHTVCCQGI